jgi:hypothetical protein
LIGRGTTSSRVARRVCCEALAVLLEAAGQVALERAGAILDERI